MKVSLKIKVKALIPSRAQSVICRMKGQAELQSLSRHEML